jgi:hypothetical protein
VPNFVRTTIKFNRLEICKKISLPNLPNFAAKFFRASMQASLIELECEPPRHMRRHFDTTVRGNMTMDECIEKARVSRATFYSWLRLGIGPRTYKVLHRRFCTPEEWEAWQERLMAEEESRRAEATAVDA